MNVKRRALVLVLLASVGMATAEEIEHRVVNGGWTQKPTVPESMSQRIEDAATEYRSYAPIPRIALFDIAYPSSAAELRELGGHAVILITMLSQSDSELPPARVFARFGAQERDLMLISGASSASRQGTTIATVFGEHRWDGLYLVPMDFVRDGGIVVTDFAANRSGFIVGRFSESELVDLPFLKAVPAASVTATVPRQVLQRFIAREYPGFLEKR